MYKIPPGGGGGSIASSRPNISGTTKPIDVNSTLCVATLTLRIIKRVSKKGVMITATNNQF